MTIEVSFVHKTRSTKQLNRNVPRVSITMVQIPTPIRDIKQHLIELHDQYTVHPSKGGIWGIGRVWFGRS